MKKYNLYHSVIAMIKFSIFALYFLIHVASSFHLPQNPTTISKTNGWNTLTQLDFKHQSGFKLFKPSQIRLKSIHKRIKSLTILEGGGDDNVSSEKALSDVSR